MTDTTENSGTTENTETPENAQAAYTTAFTDPNCLKMVLAWRP